MRSSLKTFLRPVVRTGKRSTFTEAESSPVAVLAAQIIFCLHGEDKQWPLELLELYLEDALGPRQWVDSEGTKLFCRNLQLWANKKISSDMSDKSSLLKRKRDVEVPDGSGESSGEEEILEESQDHFGNAKRLTIEERMQKIECIDRFSHIAGEAQGLVIRVLRKRAGLQPLDEMASTSSSGTLSAIQIGPTGGTSQIVLIHLQSHFFSSSQALGRLSLPFPPSVACNQFDCLPLLFWKNGWAILPSSTTRALW